MWVGKWEELQECRQPRQEPGIQREELEKQKHCHNTALCPYHIKGIVHTVQKVLP